MQNVSSTFSGVGHPASPEMVGLGDPGAMARVRPGAHGGAGRGAQILLGGAGRRAQVCSPMLPCPPCILKGVKMVCTCMYRVHPGVHTGTCILVLHFSRF